jgi:glycosyltransferase involved in cell wall biosynthesis
MKISVVCPFYNEEAIIVAATKRMIANLHSQFDEWELIMVNDGSRDRSLAMLLAALDSQRLDRVRIISCSVNQGRGRALKNGIDAAIGDIIVTTEADCSWGDDIVQRLVNELHLNPETHFAVASPHLPGGGLVNVPLRRRLLTAIGNRLIRAFFTSSVTMNTGMTRAYRREVIQPLEVWENGKEFHLEVLLKLVCLGFRVREIPAFITWQEHKLATPGSATRVSSTRIFKTIGTHLRFLATAKPTQYFTMAAGFSVVTGGCLISWAFWNLLHGAPAVYLAIVGLLMLLFALLFTGFAVFFVKLGETTRDQWLTPYRSVGSIPPSILPVRQVFPPL